MQPEIVYYEAAITSQGLLQLRQLIFLGLQQFLLQKKLISDLESFLDQNTSRH